MTTPLKFDNLLEQLTELGKVLSLGFCVKDTDGEQPAERCLGWKDRDHRELCALCLWPRCVSTTQEAPLSFGVPTLGVGDFTT